MRGACKVSSFSVADVRRPLLLVVPRQVEFLTLARIGQVHVLTGAV